MIINLEHHRAAHAARRNARDANLHASLFAARALTADPADDARAAILRNVATEYERLATHYGNVAERHERAAVMG